MSIQKSSLFRTKKDYVNFLLIVLVLLPAFLVVIGSEILIDRTPDEAIAFFKHEINIAPGRNGAYALIGLNAPGPVKDSVQWAIQRSQYLSKLPKRLASDNTAEYLPDKQPLPRHLREEAELRRAADRFHYYCWLPGGEESANGCISGEELDSILAGNRVFLERYRKAIRFEQVDITGLSILRHNTIELTFQFTAMMWKNRRNLSPQDLQEISQLMWFWKNMADTQNPGLVHFAIILVNYGLAQSLFYETARLYPQIIDIYYQQHGSFDYYPTDQSLHDRLTKGEFYDIAGYYCLDREGGFQAVSCPNLIALFFKPGRTVDLMYRGRYQFTSCSDNSGDDGDYPDSRMIPFQLRTWARPGNFQGRTMVFELYNSYRNSCEYQRNYKYKNELIAFFALYHSLKSKNLSHAEILQKADSRDTAFRIPNSQRFFAWQQDSKTLVYMRPNSDGKVRYALPIEQLGL